MDLLAFFRREAAAPPGPHPNPEGGHHWYHGTPLGSFDEEDEHEGEGPPNTPDRWGSEYYQHADHHWNTDLGSHWTSLPETARFFANHMNNGPSRGDGRIATASLHMGNPKHYKSEFDMSAEAVHWAKSQGFRHLPDEDEAHDTFVDGGRHTADGYQHLEDGAMDGYHTRAGAAGHTEQVPYDNHPENGLGNSPIRKAISAIDREDEDVTGDELKTIHGGPHLDSYLRGHPFREEITTGFKKHLMDRGHDGVTYGNEYESPNGHICAIPFHDDHINLHKWEPIKHFDRKNYEPMADEVPGQQALVQPTWAPGVGAGWETHDGKTAAKDEASVQDVKDLLGTDAWHRAMTLGEATGESMHVPTPSHDMPRRKGYKPGDDLAGIDKGPYVGWVKTEHLLKHREYDRRGKDANPDSPATIAHIRSTMRESGMTDPLILSHDPHSDRAMLVEGNHRLQAAVEEGWPAVPVHVVRAYRREAEQMPRTHYLGSHKVQPDEHGYTPGTLHPRDALPDHYLHEGTGKTAAVWHEPRPEYDDAADYETNRDRRDRWQHETRKALSRGDLSPQQAVENGYRSVGHDSGDGPYGTAESLGWKPLPQDLYHVTTDLKGTLAHGLKSRRDLGQEHGRGLGGGEDDTISFTTDKHLAHSILDSMHEFHDVVNGRKTPAHMWDEAQQGTGAARPFHEELERSLQNHWTGGIHPSLRGQKVIARGGTEPPEPGCEPWKDGDHVDTAKGTFHTHWVRPMTDEEQREHAVGFYKRFSAMREYAGGRPDPVFFSTDTSGFAKMDPSNFGIVHAKPKPGAHGYPVSGMGEWRTADGRAVDLTHHSKTARWLPHDRDEVASEDGYRTAVLGESLEGEARRVLALDSEHSADGVRAGLVRREGAVDTPSGVRVGHGTDPRRNVDLAPVRREGVLQPQAPVRWVAEGQRAGHAGEGAREVLELGEGSLSAGASVRRAEYPSESTGLQGLPSVRKGSLRSGNTEATAVQRAPGGEASLGSFLSRWLPRDRIFGPGHGGLDPRLFDAKKKMRPEISEAVLGTLDAFWRDIYPDWREWTHVYLAGSEASEWYGNNDFDTLLGIEHKKLRKGHPEMADMLDEDIDAYLTVGLRDGLTSETGDGVWFVVPSGTWLHDEHSNPMLWQNSSGATPKTSAQRPSSLANTESTSRRSAGISDSLGSVEIWHDETVKRMVERPSSAHSVEHRLPSSRGSASPVSLGITGRTTSGSSTASPSRTTSDSWSSRVAAAASAIARRGRSVSLWTMITRAAQASERAGTASGDSSASAATTRSATLAKNTSTPLSLMWLAEPHGLPDGLIAVGPFEMTWYVNPNSWDIRAIKPYAAYDITRGRWIVEPLHPASDWGPEKLPSSYWDEAEAIVRQVHAIEAMPEPMRTGRAAALFDYLHHDRRRAFGPHGTGVYDPGNATWKYLDLHPDQPLGILIDLKRRYENEIAQEATA